MTTIKFDDFLENELADNNFKEGFLTEKAILESAIAVSDARQTAGLTQRGASFPISCPTVYHCSH